MNETMFLGHPVSFWIELKRRADEKLIDGDGYSKLLAEIASLRGKVSFYESRVTQLYAFKQVGSS